MMNNPNNGSIAIPNRSWENPKEVIIVSSSDEEDDMPIVLSRDNSKKLSDSVDPRKARSRSLEYRHHRSSSEENKLDDTIVRSATDITAQSVSRSWRPGPCRPSMLSSPSPSVSSPPSMVISMDLPDAYKKRREQDDYLPITQSWLFKGIKATISDLPLSEIEHSHEEITSRRKIKVLAEYTWIEITKGQQNANVLFPAVYVPGQPRVWQGITTPSAPLDASSELPIIIDEHPQRQQAFPFEPTFRVIQALQLAAPSHPTTDFRNVDIVSDAATLASLFSFLDDPSPTKCAPFRLELSTVRNTLFLAIATHRGCGHTDKGGRGNGLIPAWVAPALTTLGTGGHATGPLFLSGNHFRLVRYRLGALVVVVRTKVDFALDNRTPLLRNEDPPFRGCQYERYHATDEAGTEQIFGFQTLVKSGKGRGTRPGAVGVTSARFARGDCATTMAAKMPLLWFGRIPFVLDGVVSREFEVLETKLYSARESYGSWEKQHQTGLRLMAGALEQLQGITRAAGGNCVVIADPGQRCFRLSRPVIKRFPVPESLALAVWGPDEDHAETVYASSTESDDDSTLSQLSGTPSGFSDWKLGESMPEMRATGRRRAVAGSRRVVETWLVDDESDDEDDTYGRRKGPSIKKDLHAWARNPILECIGPDGRARPPLGSSMMDGLDGAADYDDDEEEDGYVDEDYEDDEDVDDDDMAAYSNGDRADEMGDEAVSEEDEDDPKEKDSTNGGSQSVTLSETGLSSSPAVPSSPMDWAVPSSQDDAMADDDAIANHPIPSVELDDLRV